MITENGWPSCRADQLDRTPIPGTDIILPLQQGQPSKILKAFAADLNWYVESAYNSRGSADEGGWTQTNSVPTSNHIGGTAFDYNWSDHPMGPAVEDAAAGWLWSEIVGGNEIPRVRELLEFYEGMVFWGADWRSPKDSMHFQMGYGTYGDSRTQDFINRKIKSNGFSSFKEHKEANTPNVDVTLLLSEAMGGTVGVNYQAFVASVRQCLQNCECNNIRRIAMWCAQVGTESAGLKYMEEIASGDAYEGRVDLGNTQPGDGRRFKGRGPIQVTGRHNYTVLSKWAFEKGLVSTPNMFVNNPDLLASITYGFMGVTWYWTTQRPLNTASDAGDVTLATKYVNGGNHGLPDRKARYARCMEMGDRILNLTVGDDDWMSDPEIVKMIKEIHGALFNPIASQSRYKEVDEGKRWRLHELVKNDDGMVHESYVERLAILGDPQNIKLVARNASGSDEYAKSVLLRIEDRFLTTEQKSLKGKIAQERSE